MSTSSFPEANRVSRRQRLGGRGWPVLGFAVVVLLVGAAAVAWTSTHGSSPTQSDVVLYKVEPMTLVVEVQEQGHLESASNVNHVCELESRSGGPGGGTTILWVIPEGTEVKKGELLVDFDSSYLADMLRTQQIAVQNGLASLAKAKTDAVTARKTIEEYETGAFVRELKTLQADVTVAEENLRRARKNQEFTDRLYRGNFVNRLDQEAAVFAVRNAELNLDKARTSLEVLLKVTKDKTLTQLRGDLESKEAFARGEAERLSQEQARQQKYQVQLQKCKMYAAADGMVVYFVTPGRYGEDEETKVRAGAIVRERKNLIIIPDLKRMQLRMTVHESKIGRVRAGQAVSIRVDAFSDHVLSGRVELVGTAPEPGPWYDSEKRNYPVIVAIDKPIDGLRPGMTALGNIQANHLKDVLAVPVQCVQYADGKSYCHVPAGNGVFEQREVALGDNNDMFVQVLAGLSAGDLVVQSPGSSGSQTKAAKAGDDTPSRSPDQAPGQSLGGPNAADSGEDEGRGPPPGAGPPPHAGRGEDGEEEEGGGGRPPHAGTGRGPDGEEEEEEDGGGPPPHARGGQ